jgi:hypothetical protein
MGDELKAGPLGRLMQAFHALWALSGTFLFDVALGRWSHPAFDPSTGEPDTAGCAPDPFRRWPARPAHLWHAKRPPSSAASFNVDNYRSPCRRGSCGILLVDRT